MFKLEQRKNTLEKFNKISNSLEHVLLIHYSCESFFNIQDGRTPRITSIAIQNAKTSQTESFSIHKIAEIDHISVDEIKNHYDELEKKMLDEYFEYIQKRDQYTFVHWNMRDINYGFSAIEHRYQVLGGTPFKIADDKKIDLAIALIDIYSKKYSGHGEFGRFYNLIKINDITDRGMLNGKQEAEAFENANYIALHQSTLRKVNCLSDVLYKTLDKSLVIEASFKDIYGVYPKAFVEYIKDHWIWSLIVIIVIIFGFSINVKKTFFQEDTSSTEQNKALERNKLP